MILLSKLSFWCKD